VRSEQVQAEPYDFVSQALGLDGPGSMARASDPVTSHEAASSVSREAREASERDVLDCLIENGAMTDEQIHEEISSYVVGYRNPKATATRHRTARAQLVEKGLVRDSGEKDLTSTGRRAVLWEVVR